MPAFNAERTIGQAIASVLAQTYTEFELIICDDASSDRTIGIVQSFRDDRIRLLCNSSTLGPGPSKDRAILESRATWITFLDADDQYAENRLATLLATAACYPEDIVADDVIDCHDTPNGLIPWRAVWNERNFEPRGTAVRTVDFIRYLREPRELIKPFVNRQRILAVSATHGISMNGEDMNFLLHFFAHGSVIRYVPQPLYMYRMSPGSLSTSNPDRHRLYRNVFIDARPLFSDDLSAITAINEKVRYIENLMVYQSFYAALRERNFSGAWHVICGHPWVIVELFRRVFKRVPFHVHRLLHQGSARRVA